MYILRQNRRDNRTSFIEMRTWLSQHRIHITLNEKSFLFGIDSDQNNNVNMLVLIEIKY